MEQRKRSGTWKWLVAGVSVLLAVAVLTLSIIAAHWDTFSQSSIFGTNQVSGGHEDIQDLNSSLLETFEARILSMHIQAAEDGHQTLSLKVGIETDERGVGSEKLAREIAIYVQNHYQAARTMDSVVIRFGERPFAFSTKSLKGAFSGFIFNEPPLSV